MLKRRTLLAVVVIVTAVAFWSSTHASSIELPWASFSGGGVSIGDNHNLVGSISTGQPLGNMSSQETRAGFLTVIMKVPQRLPAVPTASFLSLLALGIGLGAAMLIRMRNRRSTRWIAR